MTRFKKKTNVNLKVTDVFAAVAVVVDKTAPYLTKLGDSLPKPEKKLNYNKYMFFFRCKQAQFAS